MQIKHFKVVSCERDNNGVKIIYEKGYILEWFFYMNKEPVCNNMDYCY